MTRHEPANAGAGISDRDEERMMARMGYSAGVRAIIRDENLLPARLLNRIHSVYPERSRLLGTDPLLFEAGARYEGIEGFRRVLGVLSRHGIQVGDVLERELFIDVYRFMATGHVLNAIDWRNGQTDSLFHLVFPQPNVLPRDVVAAYARAATPEARAAVAADHRGRTNPHDGHQRLNRPWFTNDEGECEIVRGSQHKYPQCQLVFDRTSQNCIAYCTYCFRHAQVRGEHDAFVQEDVGQVHRYLRSHPEVTDLLLTGGDAGLMPPARFEQYVGPIVADPSLFHVRTVRFASRALTYQPDLILSPRYRRMLDLFQMLVDGGVQMVWMAHFSTPAEILNPTTIAAVRRLQRYGAMVRSQSPMMRHISLFDGPDGRLDIERSARNWIDLANLLATLRIGFHSMYCARPTGEHGYFAAPLAEVEKVAARVWRSLPSINRPSRYLSMTTSAGKISILGTAVVNGEKVFALKFTQGRNMAWLDRVFLAKYDERQNNVTFLEPFGTDGFFFEHELAAIERDLARVLGTDAAPVHEPACAGETAALASEGSRA